MKVIRPVALTDAVLTASSVAEDEQPAWAADTTYALGALVLRAHRIWASTLAGNIGSDPTVEGTAWIDTGPTNRWAMLAPEAGPRTIADDSVEVTLALPVAIDTIGLIDIDADSVRLRVLDGTRVDRDDTVEVAGTVVTFSELGAAAGQTAIVTATRTGEPVAIGKLVIGSALDLGETETGPTVGITDYSRRETDDFGVTTVVERGWAKRLSIRSRIDAASVDEVQRELAALRALATLWIEDGVDALTVYGTFKDFSVDLQLGTASFCSLTIEGLPSETGALPALDPAAEGASNLRVLRPLGVDDAALTASSLAEDDYPAWDAGTVYDTADRVIRGHRICEGLLAGNIGYDPLITAGYWLDIGPTNRWAMFDQALGTVSSADGEIVVTLDPGTPIAALALLDVAGATVRVQGTYLDETRDIEGGQLPTMAFFDLDQPADATIVVTIVGASPGAAVSVGTLLVGGLEALGVTEVSPSVGITDFSRKETDDFGNTSFVERAWTKRMTLRTLIATEAVDVQVRRIASLRATPALWIGEALFDSLMIYGFFRDFSVEIGETVSLCSVTVEGLSTAIVFKGAQVAWTDIADDDPAHPKPADGATVNRDRGVWAAGTAYLVGDEVQDQGSTWGSLVAHVSSAENAPPTLPTLGNSFWRLRAMAGAAAKALRVFADRQAIKYNGAGLPMPSTQTTTFSAGRQNTTATVSWAIRDLAGNVLTPTSTYLSADTGTSVTMTRAQFEAAVAVHGSEGVVVTASLLDGVALADSAAVYRVQDGSAAEATGQIAVMMTRPAANLWAYANGTIVDWSPASGQVRVLEGGVDVTASAAFEATNSAGMLGDISEDGAYAVTALTARTGTMTITVTYADKTYTLLFGVTVLEGGYEIVADLPTADLFDGRLVYLTSDGKLYRYVTAEPTGTWAIETGITPNGLDMTLADASYANGALFQDLHDDSRIAGRYAAELAFGNDATVLFCGPTDFPVTGGETLYLQYVVQSNSGPPSEACAGGINWFEADGTPLAPTDLTAQTQATLSEVAGAWTSKQSAVVVPSGAARAQPYVRRPIFTSNSFYVGEPYLDRYEPVAALPTTGLSGGRLVYLTTDHKLYRFDADPGDPAGGWTAAVPAADIDGQIPGTQIEDGGITTPKLATGAVTTDKVMAGAITAAEIGVTQLSAITATIGTLRTASSGGRVEIKDNLQQIFDFSNVVRVRVGLW